MKAVVAQRFAGGEIRFNVELDATDHLVPCPFCGGTPELMHTHTPSYWLECECGAEMDGGYGPELLGRKRPRGTRAEHLASAEDAVRRWNTRFLPQSSVGIPEPSAPERSAS